LRADQNAGINEPGDIGMIKSAKKISLDAKPLFSRTADPGRWTNLMATMPS
jgi:hypothetical protein